MDNAGNEICIGDRYFIIFLIYDIELTNYHLSFLLFLSFFTFFERHSVFFVVVHMTSPLKFTGWRPVVAVFYKILFSCNRHIVFSDSTFLFNKLGVNVGILLLYFFK